MSLTVLRWLWDSSLNGIRCDLDLVDGRQVDGREEVGFTNNAVPADDDFLCPHSLLLITTRRRR